MSAHTITGDPLRIGDRTVTPVVRVSRISPPMRRTGAAFGAAMVRTVPVAVVERRGGRERRIPIPDVTSTALRAMATAAIALWIVLWAARWRWGHDR